MDPDSNQTVFFVVVVVVALSLVFSPLSTSVQEHGIPEPGSGSSLKEIFPGLVPAAFLSVQHL